MKVSKMRRSKSLMAEINVVPYIDVMLVLLIIFMIATPLLRQGVQVNLPQANAKPLTEKQKEPIIVTVGASGQYYLNISEHPNQPISSVELATRIAAELQLAEQAGQPRAVLIKGDQTVDYGKVMQAMVLLQQAGVADVGLMTKPAGSAAA